MDEQNLEAPTSPLSSPEDKTQVIMDLVSALDAFESATPVTGFPEKMADKAKAARALAAELKDDLLLLKQNLEEAGKDLVKLQGAGSPPMESAPADEAELGRFASLSSRLDCVASECERRGLRKLAATIDTISNSLEKKSFTFKDPETTAIFDVFDDYADNIYSGDNTAKAGGCWAQLKAAAGLMDDNLSHLIMPKIKELGQLAEESVPMADGKAVESAVNDLTKTVSGILKAHKAGQS